MLERLTDLGAGLADLVLPAACAGCAAERVPLRRGACADCVALLDALRPFAAAPSPAPAGLPPCVALGRYDGVLREAVLSYKERGRHRLAVPLGALLAGAVATAAAEAAGRPSGRVLVVPVPSTARAARERHGDHVARLATHCVRRLRVAGWQALTVHPLRALPRPDSALLDGPARAAAARASLRLRPRRAVWLRRAVDLGGTVVVVVDDILTTGATLTAVAERLAAAGVPVAAGAVLAATPWRGGRGGGSTVVPPDGAGWAIHRESVLRTRDDGRASER